MWRIFLLVVTALWVGSQFCIGFVIAPYLFALGGRKDAVVVNTDAAAELIGPLLRGTDGMGMMVGAFIGFGLAVGRGKGGKSTSGGEWLCAAATIGVFACSAVNLVGLSPAVRMIRQQLVKNYGAFYVADRADPLYQRFSTLHLASTAVFTLGLVVGIVLLVALTLESGKPCPRGTEGVAIDRAGGGEADPE